MTVRELIDILKGIDLEGGGGRIVVLASDEEGNGYGTLSESGINTMCYANGEVGIEELTPELEDQGYSEEDILDGDPALILYP